MSTQDNHSKVPLASIFGKRLDLAFDGGILTSDSGVLLLREVEAKMGILSRIIEAIKDRRHPSYVAHSVADLNSVCFRILLPGQDLGVCLPHLMQGRNHQPRPKYTLCRDQP